MVLIKSVSGIHAAALSVVICLFVLSGCNLSTSGDVTPPPGQQTEISTGAQPDATTTAAATAPVSETDPSAGQTPGSTQPAEVIFTGRVINSSGGQVPAGLEVTLQIYEAMELVSEETTTVQENTVYRFEPQQVKEDRLFRVLVEYEGLRFSSEILDPFSTGASGEIPLDLLIYEQTTSTEGLIIERAHVFFTAKAEETIQAVVYLLISNPTARVVTAAEGRPALAFSVPENAINLQVDDGGIPDRILLAEDGFGDKQSIYPGMQAHEVLYSFELPYSRSLELALEFPLPVEGGTLVLPQGFKIRGDGLADSGEREMSASVVRLFEFGSLPADEPLVFEISGRAKPGSLSTGALVATGVGAFAIVLLISVLWLRKRTTEPPAGPESAAATPLPEDQTTGLDANSFVDANSLLDSIIRLDHEFEEGRIPEEEYRQSRERLKDRLRQVRKP